jgi:hypothetical protein
LWKGVEKELKQKKVQIAMSYFCERRIYAGTVGHLFFTDVGRVNRAEEAKSSEHEE